VVGDVDMDQFSTVVSKDQKSEEQAEGEGGTTKKSTATMSQICASRTVRYVEDGAARGAAARTRQR
jgi:hypothetical protein